MRILVLADIRFPLERANGIQTAETCQALAQRGHQVTLLVRPDVVRPPRDAIEYYGLTPMPALSVESVARTGPAALRRALYLMAATRRAIGPQRADALLTRDLGVADALLRLPSQLRPPVIYESHGFAPTVASEMPALLTDGRRATRTKLARLFRREHRVWRRADGYATITQSLADELQARFGKRDALKVVPDGVRLASDRAFTLRQIGSSPTVGYSGHLYPWKGVDVLLHALVHLPQARGLIVGGHPAEQDLERTRALAARLGLEARVTFTGWLEPRLVAAALASVDLLALPNTATRISASYTSPLKLFEYPAAGKPVVASDLPSIREVLIDGENAVLVPPGDATAFAAGIKRVADDPSLAERLARQAFSDAATFSWDKRAQRLEELIQATHQQNS